MEIAHIDDRTSEATSCSSLACKDDGKENTDTRRDEKYKKSSDV